MLAKVREVVSTVVGVGCIASNPATIGKIADFDVVLDWVWERKGDVESAKLLVVA